MVGKGRLMAWQLDDVRGRCQRTTTFVDIISGSIPCLVSSTSAAAGCRGSTSSLPFPYPAENFLLLISSSSSSMNDINEDDVDEGDGGNII